MEILLTIIVFLVVITIHSILHRYLYKYGIIKFESMLLYPIGLVVLILAIYASSTKYMYPISLPLISIGLYIFLSCFMVLVYITPFLKTKMPSNLILEALESDKKLNYKNIVGLFRESEVIDKRLNDLYKFGLATQNNHKYKLTIKGKIIYKTILTYEKIFSRPIGG